MGDVGGGDKRPMSTADERAAIIQAQHLANELKRKERSNQTAAADNRKRLVRLEEETMKLQMSRGAVACQVRKRYHILFYIFN